MKKVGILQSNYIPWKGYFDLIAAVDEFIIYDEVQFTKNDWRNRNKIKTINGPCWLSIPVGQKISRKINEVILEDPSWQKKHWQIIVNNYKNSPYFEDIMALLTPLYLESNFLYLSDLNCTFIKKIMSFLNIKTKLSNSQDFEACEGKNEKLVDICLKANASTYVSGLKAKNYLDIDLFERNNIRVEWFDYSNYPQYPQLWGEFYHEVSIIDLLFNCGENAPDYMKCK
jgi:glutaredoxin-related protein